VSATWRLPLAIALTAVLVAPGHLAPVAPTQAACEDLVALTLADATIVRAATVSGGTFRPPQATAPLTGLPSFCRVSALVAPAINIEVWLPLDAWNGRFQGVGGGGFAGVISWGALASALLEGYAAASTDTGHVGFADAGWAIGHPELLADFGHRAVHEMTRVGKAVTEALYGAAPSFSYFTGCSTGGRQGLMEAQRYPYDYDGILSGAPAIDWSALHAAQLWDAQATLLDPSSELPPARLAAVHDAVLAAWDAVDGVVDGVIDDPSVVRLDFSALQAASGLTDSQLTALRRLYAGPTDSFGQSVYPGLTPGGELMWQPVISGPAPFPIGEAVYRDMVMQDSSWDWARLNFDGDVALARVRFGDVLDTLDPKLAPFFGHGGRLILYHGQADPLIAAERTRRYYDEVVHAAGRDGARLFLIGGVGHCRGGAGTDSFDGPGALAQWVESDVVPDRLVAAHLAEGKVDRTRPLCAYPARARWTGKGSTDDEASFACIQVP
jgi:feruloyl esterase